MHDQFRNHASEEEPTQTQRESKASPVMTILQRVKSVSLEVDVSIKVHLMKRFHWDLALAMVLKSILVMFEIQVVLDRPPWIARLLILAR